MSRIVVVHRSYGCDTGCCGHAVEVDDALVRFEFGHPARGVKPMSEAARDYIRALVTETCGEAHVADIDWDNCVVSDGMGC